MTLIDNINHCSTDTATPGYMQSRPISAQTQHNKQGYYPPLQQRHHHHQSIHTAIDNQHRTQYHRDNTAGCMQSRLDTAQQARLPSATTTTPPPPPKHTHSHRQPAPHIVPQRQHCGLHADLLRHGTTSKATTRHYNNATTTSSVQKIRAFEINKKVQGERVGIDCRDS